MDIIIDTNFILVCIKQGIDLFSQLDELFPVHRVVIPARVLNELEALSKDKKLKLKERESASLALQIISKKKHGISFIESEENVDETIVDYARSREDVVVASLDRELRKKAKARFLAIREKKRLWLA